MRSLSHHDTWPPLGSMAAAARDALLRQLPGLEGGTADERSSAITDSAYWQALCPKLHVGCNQMRRQLANAILDPDPDLVDELRWRMERDGYWDISASARNSESGQLHLDWLVSVPDMADGVRRLTEAGWPPSFLLMYDEPWVMAAQLKHLILMTSGNRLIFDFAMFHVGSQKTPAGEADELDGASSRGWPPHRDRGLDSTTGAFRNDGTPQYCTTWVALTDATPYSSCLMCIPKQHDPGYGDGDGTADPMHAMSRRYGSSRALQYIRALPVTEGSIITFSHRLLHWGSAADSVARESQGHVPRIAFSFACADPGFEPPFLTPHAAQVRIPSVSVRAGLVAGLALFYAANENPGIWRLRLYWDIFRSVHSGEGCFTQHFANVCQSNFAALEAACESRPQDCGGDDAAPVVGDTSPSVTSSVTLPWSPSALLQWEDRTAVVWLDTAMAATPHSITYGTLVSMATRVAAVISRAKTHPLLPCGVGMCLDHSLCIAVCQLAAVWAGGHFVPLPIDLLTDGSAAAAPHMLAMLQDVQVVFCSPQHVETLEKLTASSLHPPKLLPIDDAELMGAEPARLCMANDGSYDGTATVAVDRCGEAMAAHHRFCTFHTSGTTGSPKAVHSTHAEFAAFATAAAAPYRLSSDSRIFVATSHVFDPSAGMEFAAWAAGAAVCLAPWQQTLQHLREYVELTGATHACSTPSVWALYALDGATSATVPGTVLLGGEPMPVELIRAWLNLGVTLVNTYGTTEATVYQFAYVLPPAIASLPDADIQQHALCLGEPFDGISVDVVSSNDASALEATAGELVLSGLQVGGPDRWNGTSDRFYTGDLVRRTATGGLTFAGRADRQVKINGRRVELGPIETVIVRAMYPVVSRAVVLFIRQRLVAFCMVDGSLPIAHLGLSAAYSAAIRHFCQLELPSYMVPSCATFLAELPVTATGKTDQGALTDMAPLEDDLYGEQLVLNSEWTPTGWLRAVRACWATELGMPLGHLHPASDFCALSGNSLVALRICSRLWQQRPEDGAGEAGGVFGERMGAFSPARLLDNPVLESYAAMLSAASEETTAKDASSEYDLCSDASQPERVLSAADQLAVQAEGIGALGLLRILLRRDDCTLSTGLTNDLLVSAVHKQHSGCAELLLDHGASPNAVGVGGVPVLSMAVQHKSSDQARSLLARGANVRAVDRDGQTAMHHASRTGSDALCLQMLISSWDDATAPSQSAHEPTAPTSGEDDSACSQLDRWGRTPLHWATANGHRDAVVALVEAGSDMHLRDFQEESSMEIAERRAECREWLNGQDGVRCDKLTLSMLRLMAA